jgi:hypothetical protein
MFYYSILPRLAKAKVLQVENYPPISRKARNADSTRHWQDLTIVVVIKAIHTLKVEDHESIVIESPVYSRQIFRKYSS